MLATHRPRGPSTDAAMLHENLIIAKSGPTRIRMMAASYKDASGRGLMVCPHLSQTPRLVPSSSFSMPRKRRVLSLPQKLPPCDGPKLNIFPYHKSRIQWLERLDEDDDVTSSQGYVFRALIRGREYAVKVFKFFDPMSTEYFWGPLLGEDTSLDTAAYYTDPFYAECRAYGRIREGTDRRILKSDVAVASHGFFFLESKDQEALQNRNIDLGLDSVDINYQRSTIGGLRARAIVKDVASPESGITSTNMRRILGKLVSMNKAGIYNMDIRIDNFRDGRLVDFGSSWTEPHALLGSLSYEAATESKLADRVMFEQMIEDEELMNSGEVKAIHHMQLRSQVQRH